MKKLVNFRLSVWLLDNLRKIAHKEQRSLTAQVEYFLTQNIEDYESTKRTI